jgi:hypothetical protein
MSKISFNLKKKSFMVIKTSIWIKVLSILIILLLPLEAKMHHNLWTIFGTSSHSIAASGILCCSVHKYMLLYWSHWSLNNYGPFLQFLVGLCRLLFKMNQTKFFSKILLMKSSKTILFFYLYFTWLCVSWKPQRILKKYLFWKYGSWFPSEVSKLTSVKYPWNDAFSSMTFFIFTNIAP